MAFSRNLLNCFAPSSRIHSCFPGFTTQLRCYVIPPQYWYFMDTEGNLLHNHKRRRTLSRRSAEAQQGKGEFALENVENLLKQLQNDMPMKGMPNPYKKDREECILCKYNITLDYKNARLLSQFVSRFTGRVYDRQTTGLCKRQDLLLNDTLKLSRRAGFMPFMYTEPVFFHDPRLYDAFNPKRLS